MESNITPDQDCRPLIEKENETFSFSCPHCGQKFDCIAECHGRACICPVCQQEIYPVDPGRIRVFTSTASTASNSNTGYFEKVNIKPEPRYTDHKKNKSIQVSNVCLGVAFCIIIAVVGALVKYEVYKEKTEGSSGTERHKFNPFIKIGENIENDIHKKVANDAVKAYELAVKGGDKIEIAVCAGLVVAAYRQANDEANYLRWKEIEKYAKEAAGLR